MKILLIQPSEERAMIHLGLAYVAAALERRGDDVVVLDTGTAGGSEKVIARFMAEANPGAVGITAQTPYYSKALKASKLVRKLKPGCTVIMGGPHPSILTEDTLKEPSIDIVVKGESDITIVELMERLETGGALDDVKGISFKKNGVIIHNEYRPFIEDLDSLPNPAWHLFDMSKYLAKVNGKKVAPVLSSRGCPFKCIFCYRGPAAGKTFRARAPENIVNEIKHLKQTYGIGNILFVDDIFTVNQKRAEKICDIMIETKLDIPWRCQTRVDCLNIGLLKKMKEANCTDISMGVESGNEKILETTGKRTTKEKVRKAFSMIKEAGISISSSFIIGLPGDTKETVRETIDFAKELNPDNAIFYAAMPYPGTEMAHMVVEQGGQLPETWDAYRLMSSDVSSSKILADLKISGLSEKELRYFLKTAQIDFQMARLGMSGDVRDAGLKNMIQILRLKLARSKSFADTCKFIMRMILDSLAFIWGKLFRR